MEHKQNNTHTSSYHSFSPSPKFSQLPNRRKPKRKKKKTREIGTELGPADAGEVGVAAAIIERESQGLHSEKFQNVLEKELTKLPPAVSAFTGEVFGSRHGFGI